MKEKNINKINIVFDIIKKIFISIIIFLSIFPNDYKYVVVICVICWAIAEMISSRKNFINFFIKPNNIMYPIYISLILYFIVSMIFKEIYMDIVTLSGIYFVSILYMYYSKKNNKRILKYIIFSALFALICTDIISWIELDKNESISRVLSTENHNILNSTGVASYSYIYSCIFMELVILEYIIRGKKSCIKTCIAVSIFLLNIIIILKAQFVISYLVLILGIILIIFRITNLKRLFISLLVTLSIIILMLPIIQIECKKLSEAIKNPIISTRLLEISNTIKDKSVKNTEDAAIRFQVYKRSFDMFVDSPLVGMMNPFSYQKPGGHSTALDMFAKYGLILPVIYLLPFVIIIMKINKYNNVNMTVSIFIFVLLSIINNTAVVSIFCIVFTVIPSISEIYIKGENNENTLDS